MDIAVVLSDKYPGAQWSLDGDDYEGLTWLDDSPKPTKKALEALWPEVENARAIALVEAARAVAYRETADPVFFRYQAGEATKEEWKAARQAVRDLHPYPETA